MWSKLKIKEKTPANFWQFVFSLVLMETQVLLELIRILDDKLKTDKMIEYFQIHEIEL